MVYQNKRYDHDRHFGRVPIAAAVRPIAGADNMEISFPLQLPPTSGPTPGAILGNDVSAVHNTHTHTHSHRYSVYVYAIHIHGIYGVYKKKKYVYIRTRKKPHTQVGDFLYFPCPKTTTVVFCFLFFFFRMFVRYFYF